MGIVLAGVAIGCLRGSAGNELCDVQARLSDAGVVGAAFETEKEGVRRVEELFDERSGGAKRRVGMVDGTAGWRFGLWGVGTH